MSRALDALGRFLTGAASRLPPEEAHRLALSALARAGELGLLASRPAACDNPALATRLGPLELPNPVGLAAGWDKDGRAIRGARALGFGFVEVGTVTPLPQAGNPPPRLFRLREDGALINRMGFPNQGAEALARRLRALRDDRRGFGGVLGINVGKGRDTPLEAAAGDYVACLDTLPFEPIDYVAINVSSPNTPGLRALQDAAPLERIVHQVVRRAGERAGDAGRAAPPVFVKLAPDAEDVVLVASARAALGAGATGIIATNTTLARPEALRASAAQRAEKGGLSGAPLAGRARETVGALRAALGPGVPLIGVGGITSTEDAWAMLRAGADAIQIMTWLTLPAGGPYVAARVCTDLLGRVRAAGVETLEQALKG